MIKLSEIKANPNNPGIMQIIKIKWHIETRKLADLKEWEKNPRILKTGWALIVNSHLKMQKKFYKIR